MPGVPQYFASALTLDGIASGCSWKATQDGPTKIEGNPDHPASWGRPIVSLRPRCSRSTTRIVSVVRKAGRISTWSGFLDSITKELERSRLSKVRACVC